MSDGTLHLPDPEPTREEVEKRLADAEEQTKALRKQLKAIDKAAKKTQEEATSCPALSEVMKRLDDIEAAIKNIQIFQFPQTITTPGTNPTPPWKPYVPWWETNRIWCGGTPNPDIQVTYGTPGVGDLRAIATDGIQIGTDFEGEY